MLYTLPEPFKGATDVQVYQVVFDEDAAALIVRGRYGSMDGSTFVPDVALAEVVHTVQGETYEAAISASGLREEFGMSVLPALFGA